MIAAIFLAAMLAVDFFGKKLRKVAPEHWGKPESRPDLDQLFDVAQCPGQAINVWLRLSTPAYPGRVPTV